MTSSVHDCRRRARRDRPPSAAERAHRAERKPRATCRVARANSDAEIVHASRHCDCSHSRSATEQLVWIKVDLDVLPLIVVVGREHVVNGWHRHSARLALSQRRLERRTVDRSIRTSGCAERAGRLREAGRAARHRASGSASTRRRRTPALDQSRAQRIKLALRQIARRGRSGAPSEATLLSVSAVATWRCGSRLSSSAATWSASNFGRRASCSRPSSIPRRSDRLELALLLLRLRRLLRLVLLQFFGDLIGLRLRLLGLLRFFGRLRLRLSSGFSGFGSGFGSALACDFGSGFGSGGGALSVLISGLSTTFGGELLAPASARRPCRRAALRCSIGFGAFLTPAVSCENRVAETNSTGSGSTSGASFGFATNATRPTAAPRHGQDPRYGQAALHPPPCSTSVTSATR